MSEFTVCNYCEWQSMKARGYRMATPEERKKVWMDDSGVVVVDSEGKFVVWFMELPSGCCC